MNYKKIKPVLILVLVVSILLVPKINLNGYASERISYKLKPEANKKWTYMIYNCADTREHNVTSNADNSYNFVQKCTFEMITGIVENGTLAGSEVDINVIVLHDYPYQPSTPNGQAIIYELKAESVGGMTQIANWGATNMGDGQVLDDFVDFCKTNYPADNYALSLVDHGRAYAGYCYDYHAPHPVWEYAIGDCLTLTEIETALSGTNNVDVIIFNTCLGGSFETAWQLVGEADYMLAGETTLGVNQLYSPWDYVYNLSRNPNITPREFAQMTFDVSTEPVILPDYRDWSSCSLYDLTEFPNPSIGFSFMDTFDLFVDSLHDELDFNITQRNFFKWLRNGLNTEGLASSESMLVDLTDFLEKIVGNQTHFHTAAIGSYAATLISMLEPDPNGVLISHYNFWDENATFPATYLKGLSFCFPDSYDMFKGFLYGNMYAGLQVNIDTRWEEFLDRLFPHMSIEKFKLKDFYEIQLFEIDPSIFLEVIYEVSPAEIYHVGLNDNFQNYQKGIEIGIEGAEYMDDLFGNFMIRILTAGLATGAAANKANGAETFQVIIDASYAASATQDVNLTVKHITDDEVVWEESQTYDIQIGQKLTTDITTDDEMSDFEVTEIPTKRFGFSSNTNVIVLSMTSFLVLLLVVYQRKKKFE